MSSDDANVEFSTGAETPEVDGKRLYRMVFIGDLGAAERLPNLTGIDKDDFAAVLERAKPALALAIKDPLGGGEDWEFQLAFDKLKTFEPAGLLRQVPGANWRLGVRDKVVARQLGQISADDLQNAISAAANADASLAWMREVDTGAGGGAAAQSAPAAPGGGSILDMVDDPDESARVKADVERAAAAAGDADAKIGGTEITLLKMLLARIDKELGTIADAVLKHPDVRRLETAWRGLKFIIDRVDFREGVRMSVLHATRDDALSRFVDHVIEPAFNAEIDTPALVIFDYECVNTAGDIEFMDGIAQQAASLPVPVALPLGAQFLNIKSLRLLKNLPNLSGLIDGWEFAKWRSLREQPYSRALAPVIGRFILRPPHSAKQRGSDFSYDENVKAINDVVWAGGHLAMAICAARSYVKHGWGTRMFGAEAGKIEDLPVVDNPTDAQNPWGPGDLSLPDRRIDELPEIGVNLVLSVKGKDVCQLMGGVSAAKPVVTAEITKQRATLEISLPYQQFSNVVSTYLCEQLPELRGLEPEKIQERLIFGLAKLMGIKAVEEMDSIQVGVGAHPENPAQTIVQVKLAPPMRIAPGEMTVEYSFAL